MTLTDKLDKLMKNRGISKMDLSRGANVPYTTIVNFYEKGTDNVKLSTLRKLANYFNCTLDYLVDDEVSEQSPGQTTIAAHLDGEELTEEELEEVNNYIEFILSKRQK